MLLLSSLPILKISFWKPFLLFAICDLLPTCSCTEVTPSPWVDTACLLHSDIATLLHWPTVIHYSDRLPCKCTNFLSQHVNLTPTLLHFFDAGFLAFYVVIFSIVLHWTGDTRPIGWHLGFTKLVCLTFTFSTSLLYCITIYPQNALGFYNLLGKPSSKALTSISINLNFS